MNAVRLKYLGKTNPLNLTMPWLKGQYTFSSENGFSCFVEKEDAEYLLKEGPNAFKVISGMVNIPEKAEGPTVATHEKPEKQPEPEPLTGGSIPEDAAPGTTPEEFKVVVEGDGVEGTGPMPEGEGAQTPILETEATKKGGKKK